MRLRKQGHLPHYVELSEHLIEAGAEHVAWTHQIGFLLAAYEYGVPFLDGLHHLQLVECLGIDRCWVGREDYEVGELTRLD